VLEPTELSITILRFKTECSRKIVEGLTFVRVVLVPIQEKVVLDRLVVSNEGVRQLAIAA
jgi:hypothetical protein